jgi:hypothetical protein
MSSQYLMFFFFFYSTSMYTRFLVLPSGWSNTRLSEELAREQAMYKLTI